MREKYPFVFLLISAFILQPSSSRSEPTYTSILEKDCYAPPSSLSAAYDKEGLTVQQCPAPKGWQLFIVSTDERSWVDISNDSRLWTTEGQVVHQNDFGLFPNISGKVAEWTVTGGTPSSLIFRISAQDPKLTISKGQVRKLSRLFVVSLRGKEPTFCGTAKTNDDARVLANESTCGAALSLRPFAVK